MNTSFFFFRKPNTTVIYGGTGEVVSKNIASKRGYVISPFNNKDYQTLIIESESTTCNIEDLNIMDSSFISENKWWPLSHTSTSFLEHINAVEKAISKLGNHYPEGKVVISRLIARIISISPSRLFCNLCINNPHAYVFAFYTPQTGLWMGASPELLISTDVKELTTMSLAGTQPSDVDELWDKKNIREQAIVTEYISNILTENGLTPLISDIYTKSAGPVQHLCCDIKAKLPEKDFELIDFCSKFSPTPALGGYPKEFAINTIADVENFNRGCYGGFSGYTDGINSGFYVTVRALHLDRERANIFVGGGITTESIPKKEWLETENKARTILASL